MDNQLFLCTLNGCTFFTALLFLEADFNSFCLFKCACTTLIGASWWFTDFDQDDVEQTLPCIYITVLLKDDRLNIVNLALKSNVHIGLYDGL